MQTIFSLDLELSKQRKVDPVEIVGPPLMGRMGARLSGAFAGGRNQTRLHEIDNPAWTKKHQLDRYGREYAPKWANRIQHIQRIANERTDGGGTSEMRFQKNVPSWRSAGSILTRRYDIAYLLCMQDSPAEVLLLPIWELLSKELQVSLCNAWLGMVMNWHEKAWQAQNHKTPPRLGFARYETQEEFDRRHR